MRDPALMPSRRRSSKEGGRNKTKEVFISGQGGGQERMLQAEARRRRVEGGVWSAASSFRNINFCESFVVVTGIEGCHGLILRPNQLGRHNKTRYSTLIRWGPRDSHISFK